MIRVHQVGRKTHQVVTPEGDVEDVDRFWLMCEDGWCREVTDDSVIYVADSE